MKTLAGGLGLLFILAQLVLAFWPVPGKYPWLLPGVFLGVAGVSAILLHRKDDGTPILLGLAAVVLLSGWPLTSLRLDMDEALLHWLAMVIVPYWMMGVPGVR